jgi:hypothetical protein
VRERIYIETTIPSFYYNTRESEEMRVMAHWTKLWWDRDRFDYDVVTSPFVLEELEMGTHPFREEKIRLLQDVEILLEDDRVRDAAKEYIRTLTMPSHPVADAFYLAFASVHSCDVLLTWNCSHLANRRKVKQISEVNRRLGLETPAIMTPHNLIADQTDEYGSDNS